jgi:hypothetical protein
VADIMMLLKACAAVVHPAPPRTHPLTIWAILIFVLAWGALGGFWYGYRRGARHAQEGKLKMQPLPH